MRKVELRWSPQRSETLCVQGDGQPVHPLINPRAVERGPAHQVPLWSQVRYGDGNSRNLRDHFAVEREHGHALLRDDPATLNVNVFKRKSVSIHLELMYTRLIYGTPDMDQQGKLLAEVARLADAGMLRTTGKQRPSSLP